MTAKIIYLAGPEVFLPDSAEIGAAKIHLCAEFGCIGLYPGDNGPFEDNLSAPDLSRRIFKANLALMCSADLLIANLTPFRGASADAGTVWELGFMAGRDKPVFGYANTQASLRDRTLALDPTCHLDPTTGAWQDRDGMIEDFGNADNLMITESLALYGHHIVLVDELKGDPRRNLSGLRACLELATGIRAL